MTDFLSELNSLFTMAFAVASMLSMGLSIRLMQMLEPLRNGRLVLMALLANFVVVPGAALILSRVLPLALDLQIGLLLVGAVAGAPMTVKLAQIARGNLAFAVSLVALLVVGTVLYLPLALPLLLPGVRVDAMAIATPLALQILLPLVVGIFVHERYEEGADAIQPVMGQIANISLVLMIILSLGLNFSTVLQLFGTGAITAMIALIAIGLVAGYLLGGPNGSTKRVLSVGTGQRNLAAAFVIAGGNFADRPDVLSFVAAVGLIGMLIVFPVAGEFGRRHNAENATEVAEAAAAGG